MHIQANGFKRQWVAIQDRVLHAVQRIGASGWYILGENVAAFEVALARTWPLGQAVGVASGLDALEIGLRCLGVRPGQGVLTTPLSAFATTLAIVRSGAVPVFVDVDERGLIDLELCREMLKAHPDVRCLLPVHLYGHPLDLDTLAELRDEFNLIVLEDCAQSIAATWRGMSTGTVGQAAATSFYPTKNLGALGDAGAILTGSRQIAEMAKNLRHYGQSAQYMHDEIGMNSRLDELHAAILLDALLPNLAEWTARRRGTAAKLRSGIDNPHIHVPALPAHAASACHLFPVLVNPAQRTGFMTHLKDHEIASAVHYPRLIPDQPALAQYGRFEVHGQLDNARRFADSEVSLPMHPFLMDEEVDLIIRVCNAWRPS